MSTTIALRTIPAAHLTFDLSMVFELARHLSIEEQDQLIAQLLESRSSNPATSSSELRDHFAAWDQESSLHPPSADEELAYDALLARLGREVAA
ncbi:hypothetical protein [Candidatus Viridilinea mediisalina]|uniref:Addiction module protein n=1 Tax=Candidatus Viridilinea mediisalina TaxID=2024553 RepID=A0A2A6RKF6_9CHLR|nr:hypothetical protein [Candidatus Viridilinea mediisalina]PDW03385.1 hypothetical protein CJ255_09005 [Candidatus Viridilinea mediisalina]